MALCIAMSNLVLTSMANYIKIMLHSRAVPIIVSASSTLAYQYFFLYRHISHSQTSTFENIGSIGISAVVDIGKKKLYRKNPTARQKMEEPSLLILISTVHLSKLCKRNKRSSMMSCAVKQKVYADSAWHLYVIHHPSKQTMWQAWWRFRSSKWNKIPLLSHDELWLIAWWN